LVESCVLIKIDAVVCIVPVIATVPNPFFGSGYGLQPNWNHCNGFYPMKKPNGTEPVVFWLVPQFGQLRHLAPIQYLSFDAITI